MGGPPNLYWGRLRFQFEAYGLVSRDRLLERGFQKLITGLGLHMVSIIGGCQTRSEIVSAAYDSRKLGSYASGLDYVGNVEVRGQDKTAT